MAYCRYWIVNYATRHAEPAYGPRRVVNDTAISMTRKTGQTHLVVRCVAHTNVVIQENK